MSPKSYCTMFCCRTRQGPFQETESRPPDLLYEPAVSQNMLHDHVVVNIYGGHAFTTTVVEKKIVFACNNMICMQFALS